MKAGHRIGCDAPSARKPFPRNINPERKPAMSRYATLLPLAPLAIATGIALTSMQPTTGTATANPASLVQRLADEAELARIPAEIEIAVDRKDWAKARSYFAQEVRIDFTSLIGGQPATFPSDGLIAGWSGNLKGSKESLRMRGQPLITIAGDKATVYSNGYAWNRMPGATDGQGDLWEVWGNYTHDLTRTAQGWKVTGFTFVKTHERGSNWVKTTPGS
jgi:hypothetical protein